MSIFYCIFGIYIEFWTFWKKKQKKKQPHSLSISETIDSETWLLKYIKGPVSENPSDVSVLKCQNSSYL